MRLHIFTLVLKGRPLSNPSVDPLHTEDDGGQLSHPDRKPHSHLCGFGIDGR